MDKPLQQRQAEGGGLAGAGLGDAQHVAARQEQRDGLGLDGGGLGVVLGRENAQKRLGKAKGGKAGQSRKSLNMHGRARNAHAERHVAVFHAHLEGTVGLDKSAMSGA